MRWGKIEVTGGFFLLVAWLNYIDRQSVVPLAIVACMLHELGHYAVIRLMGGDIKLIRLTAIGAEMVVERPLSYWQEGLAALAGPGANLMLALVFCTQRWGLTFAGLNLVLACFNLLPIGRMDGGRALYCTLALLTSPACAARVGEWLDTIFTAVLVISGLILARAGGTITLLLVALWLAGLCLKIDSLERLRNRACHRRIKRVK